MTVMDTCQQRRREILDDHQHLSDLLRGLVTPGLSSATVLGRIEDVRLVLTRHFDREEGPDGLFAIIRAKAPDRSLAIAGLQDQHRQLLGELDRISNGDWPDLRIPTQAFIGRLRAHEKAESRLLIHVLNSQPSGA